MNRFEYLKIFWHYLDQTTPVILFYEIDLFNERYATRMAEVFADRTIEASPAYPCEFVTEAAVPSAQTINQDPEFFAVCVCKEEFETVYQSHRYTQPFFCNILPLNTAEQSFVHSLFESKNLSALYRHFPQTVNQMLMIENKEDFDDFLQNGETFEESLFLLYHSAQQQNALLLGGYLSDATEPVFSFLSQKLPCSLVSRLQSATDCIFLDLDSENTPEQAVSAFNDLLSDTGYGILLQFDDTFCTGNWFLSVFYTPLPAEKTRLTNG